MKLLLMIVKLNNIILLLNQDESKE